MGPGGGLHDTLEAAGARGEGLEPSITGPEPVVLPITPPPNGWAFRLAERPAAGVRPSGRAGGALNREGLGGKMPRPGAPGTESGSEVLSMHRWSAVVAVPAGILGCAVLALPAQAGTPGMVV